MGTRRARVPAGVTDGAIAAGVAVTLLIAGLSVDRPAHYAEYAGLAYALLAISGLVLFFRRRNPIAVLVLTGLCALGYQALQVDVAAVAFLFAVYAAVRAGHRLVTVVAAVLMLITLPIAVLLTSPEMPVRAALAHSRGALEIAWIVAAFAAGEALRQAEARADEAERTREEAALRRANQERLHIARELHDSLTHQISVITVQATVAVHLARKRGEAVPDALVAIEQAGREAARELRATLEALRDDGKVSAHGLDQVPELVERARTGGLLATLTVEGQPQSLPVAVDRTAYRIVQESLTNVARHAGAATASVRIGYRPGALAIQVDDDGSAVPAAPPTPGVGLLGMRERVSALGGRLRAEPRVEGGFTVEAELPVDHAA
ncbi:sensor histidine kinase [Hamadaea sp. NPDC051192]|uniref:sensor histidine kinase n=1 Tax=Hamadaea sp. NPDC051192 TaxID=3154940 RepID=UPI00341C2EBC